MKAGVIIILALILGSVAAHFILSDAGYVLINYRNTIIEMTIPAVVGIIIAIIVIVWLSYRLLVLPRRLGQAVGQIRAERQGARFTKGLIAAAEGKLSKGERLLTRGAGKAETPLLNYLAAARVAHQQGSTERRDNWLTMAYEQSPDAGNAVLLTQAELQLASAQYEQALATIGRIREQVPNHPQATLLAGRAYAALADWTELGKILPDLRKSGGPDSATLAEWSAEIAKHGLEKADNLAELLRAWSEAAPECREDSRFIGRYVERLLEMDSVGEAEALLRKTLKHRWDGDLVRRYGGLPSKSSKKQLKTLEGWLKSRGDDADLLYAAGRVCIREELWGKARSYLESALAISATPAIYQAYGELLSTMGESDAAADAFRRGLSVAAGDATLSLPPPTPTPSEPDAPKD